MFDVGVAYARVAKVGAISTWRNRHTKEFLRWIFVSSKTRCTNQYDDNKQCCRCRKSNVDQPWTRAGAVSDIITVTGIQLTPSPSPYARVASAIAVSTFNTADQQMREDNEQKYYTLILPAYSINFKSSFKAKLSTNCISTAQYLIVGIGPMANVAYVRGLSYFNVTTEVLKGIRRTKLLYISTAHIWYI